MAALRGLPRLGRLRITGNAVDLDWRMCLRRYPRTLRALEEVALDYRREPRVWEDEWRSTHVDPVTFTEHTCLLSKPPPASPPSHYVVSGAELLLGLPTLAELG
jgi:hypothetical protein